MLPRTSLVDIKTPFEAADAKAEAGGLLCHRPAAFYGLHIVLPSVPAKDLRKVAEPLLLDLYRFRALRVCDRAVSFYSSPTILNSRSECGIPLHGGAMWVDAPE